MKLRLSISRLINQLNNDLLQIVLCAELCERVNFSSEKSQDLVRTSLEKSWRIKRAIEHLERCGEELIEGDR